MMQKTISIKGFSVNPKADDQLAIAVFGEQGSGKTRFAITAPDPIGFIPLDRKSRKTVDKIAKDLDKTVVMPDKDYIRVAEPMRLSVMKPDAAKVYYRQHVDAVKHAAFTLAAHADIKTIVVDTGTQLWEDILFAHFGRTDRIMPRDRGPANQEMIDFLNALSHKNLIITHKAKEIWKSDKPTGKYELAGFPHIGYHVNTMIEFVCDQNKKIDESDRFYINVLLCQDNPDIQGPNGNKLITDEMISFDVLSMFIFPEAQ